MNLRDLIGELAAQADQTVLLLDGFDAALLGTAWVAQDQMVAVYDYQICIGVLMQDYSLDYDGALEYFDYNIERDALPGTPIFLRRHDT